jgi:glycosyltransferase involved in cell wall biosynthesis
MPDVEDELPVVSCLMVTRGRSEFLNRAVACFRHQALTNIELVVVHDASDTKTPVTLERLGDGRIRCFAAPLGLKLGALRNLAVDSSRGEFIAQWDDDDWHSPDRLSTQLSALRASGKSACILSRWTICNLLSGAAYISNARQWEGSMLAQKKTVSRYDASLSQGEDTPIVESLVSRDEVVLLDRPDLYIYTFHGANTFGRGHWKRIFMASTELGPEETKRVLRCLSPENGNAS